MKLKALWLAVIIASPAHAEDRGGWASWWFGGPKSPVAGITREQYDFSLNVCQLFEATLKADLEGKYGHPWPETYCKCLVQRTYESFPVEMRHDVATLIPYSESAKAEFYHAELKKVPQSHPVLAQTRASWREIVRGMESCSATDLGTPVASKNVAGQPPKNAPSATTPVTDGPPTSSDIIAASKSNLSEVVSVANLSCSEIGKNQYACSFSSVRDVNGNRFEVPNDSMKVMRYGKIFRAL